MHHAFSRRPLRPTKAWILVVRPSREAPMQRDLSSLLGVGGVLMHAVAGGIDHLDAAIVSSPMSLRNVYPWRASAKRPKDTAKNSPIVHSRHPARLFGSGGWITDHSKSVSSTRPI